jgi:hypothetical protein
MEPTSPKAADMRDRSVYALHNGVPDKAGSGGEFHIRGRGLLVDDRERRSEVDAAASYDPADRYLLFELLLSEARAVGYGDVALPHDMHWTTT